MAENYWIMLLLFAIIFIDTTIIIWVGHDPRGSENFEKNLLSEANLLRRL